ncbi:hypothetical protein B296_00042676 [Ensete ventricosum]|uniref:Uncharacterized protein n=1 Tax=Ensete ventricosum TaxID=4639 RepID=A0A426YP59_ENSVE|nr:hypothetical protein B296_00042676 [Ensete ventricosum]
MAFPSSEIPHRRWSTPMSRHLSLPTVAKSDDCFASETGKELRPRRKPPSGAAVAEAAAAALRGPEPCEGGGEEEGWGEDAVGLPSSPKRNPERIRKPTQRNATHGVPLRCSNFIRRC